MIYFVLSWVLIVINVINFATICRLNNKNKVLRNQYDELELKYINDIKVHESENI